MLTRARRRQGTQQLIKAIGHPLRSEVLTILTERTASPIEMAKELDDSVGNVSYHVGRLVKLDCAELVGEKPVRGVVEHFYRAISRPLVDLEEWEQLPPAVAKHFVGQAMQKTLDDFTQAGVAGLLAPQEDLHLSRTPLLVDAEGRREALELHARTLDETLEIQARSARRMAQTSETGIPLSSSQGCFELPASA